MLSGDLARPILDADALVAIDGRIAAIGRLKDLDVEGATTIDRRAWASALAPGLIDSHVHPVAGDWTPRQSQLGWIDSCLHGGVTTMISAGEVHTPGRPRDIVGLKAMAISAQRTFSNFRAVGVKVHAGAPVIEHGHGGARFRGTRRRRRASCSARSGSAASRTARRRARWSPGRANTASTARSTPAARRSPAPASSTRTSCWRPTPTSSATSTAAIPRCPTTRSAACARAAGAGWNWSTTATSARRCYTLAHRQGARPVGARHPRHRRAGRLGRAAARHSADGLDARPRSARFPPRSRSASRPATRRGCANSIAG